MDEIRKQFEDGKYTLVRDSSGYMYALRHGEPWRDLTGDKLIGAMLSDMEELQAALAARQPVDENYEVWAQNAENVAAELTDERAIKALRFAARGIRSAARHQVRIYGCCAQPEGELHTAECPNMQHLAARQPVGDVVPHGWVLTGPEGSMFCPAAARSVMEAYVNSDYMKIEAVYTYPPARYTIETETGPLLCSLAVATEWAKAEERIAELDAAQQRAQVDLDQFPWLGPLRDLLVKINDDEDGEYVNLSAQAIDLIDAQAK